MTRVREDGIETVFKRWMREELPDSHSGFRIYDIDAVLYKKSYDAPWPNGKPIISDVMIIESKTHNSEVSEDQRLLLQTLNEALKMYCDVKGIQYHGTHLIRLSDGDPKTSKIELDNQAISIESLKDFLSMKPNIYQHKVKDYG